MAFDRTYFVGRQDWGFSVWVHNTYSAPTGPNSAGKYAVESSQNGTTKVVGTFDTQAEADAEAARLTKKAESAAALEGWVSTNALRDLPANPTRTQLDWATSENAKRLRKNLGEQIEDGEDAHHIVQSTHRRAEEARKLLDKYQIDINSAENGIGLKPTGDRPAHHGQGLHSFDGIDEVTRRLQLAVGGVNDFALARRKIIEALRRIKQEIRLGNFPPI